MLIKWNNQHFVKFSWKLNKLFPQRLKCPIIGKQTLRLIIVQKALLIVHLISNYYEAP